MRRADMGSFWDARARENAPYYVDTCLDYADPDMKAFWSSGAEVVEMFRRELALPEIAGDHLLVEIGCGLGRLTRPLAGRAGQVVALDVSEEMLRRAQALNPDLANVRWVRNDGRTLAPVADASADGVLSHVVFQHIPDPAITLGYVREIGRILRAGGWAAFQISTDPDVHRHRGAAAHARLWLRRRLGQAPRGQGHPAWLGSAVRMDDLRATAAEAGLEVRRVVGEGTQFCLVHLRRR